jgi:hypothetical protein
MDPTQISSKCKPMSIFANTNRNSIEPPILASQLRGGHWSVARQLHPWVYSPKTETDSWKLFLDQFNIIDFELTAPHSALNQTRSMIWR